MKFSKTSFGALVSAVLISACANVAGLNEELSSLKVCCRSLAEIKFEVMVSGSRKAEINENSQVFDFSQGRSRFVAYEIAALPEPQILRHIHVESAFSGVTNVYTAGRSWTRYFHPALTFLDTERKPLTTVVAKLDATLPDSCGSQFGCFAVALKADVPAAAKYFVIHQPSEYLGRTSEQVGQGIQNAQVVPVGGAFIHIGGGGPPARRIISISSGEFKVTLTK